METKSAKPSRLFLTSPVEIKDDLEEKFERSYQYLQSITQGLSDKDAHEAINKALVKDKGYEEVSFGLLVTILTEPENAAKCYRDLTLISHDGFGLILTHLSQLVLDRYLKFTDVVRTQVVWLLREMIKNAVTNVDNLCWNLMRHAAGGDVSQKNITLIESLLDVLTEYRSWLDKFPFLIASVVYTFLRLIEDHNAPCFSNLRQREVNFLISLIRERFNDCLSIGRDLIRLLQNVARIPEFEQLWKDILLNPRSLSPSFTGVLQLLQTRTSRRYLQSRLTPDMERKLVFFTSQVRFGNHKRYQDWFQRQYLATPESQSLRCDIIRFIVGVIHPTNELLCSDIIPRWAVIGWLLTTCTSSVAVSNAKLALFYDWLFFDSEKDNIMNIEPAILVMHHSMRSHPAVSATLLDFLCRIIQNFYQPLTEKVRCGIFSSLKQILDKRVLPSLLPLFDNSKLDRELRIMVRETFKEFCIQSSNTSTCSSGINETSSKYDEQQHTNFNDNDTTTTTTIFDNNKQLNNAINNHIMGTDEPAFSDEEDEPSLTINTFEDDTDDDDIPLSKVRLKEKNQDKLDDNNIDGPIGEILLKFQQEKSDNNKRCELMEELIDELLNNDNDNDDDDDDDDENDSDNNDDNKNNIRMIGKIISQCIDDDLKKDIFPDIINEKTLLDSIKLPLFILYKKLYNFTKQDEYGKKIIYKLLKEILINQNNNLNNLNNNNINNINNINNNNNNNNNKLGILLLYYLKVKIRTENKKEDLTKASALKISVYKEYCINFNKKLDQSLLDDIISCHINDTKLMMWLIPDIFRDFNKQLLNNAQIIHVILSSIDTKQLQQLVGKVLQGHLVMLKSDNIQLILKLSLKWESIEQFFFWQLIQAHDISIDIILPLIKILDYEQHSEALTSITLMLKQEKPNADYIKLLFSRNVSQNGDLFIFTIIKYWCDLHIDKVAELISSLLTTRYPSTSPNKRKRSNQKSNNNTTSLSSLSSSTTSSSTSTTTTSLNQTTLSSSSTTTTTTTTNQSTLIPSAEQVLGHLEQLRIICERHDCMAIYTLDSMQRALNIALNNSNDIQKKTFQLLFALLEEEEEITSTTTKSRSQGRGRKPANKTTNTTTTSSSSSSSSSTTTTPAESKTTSSKRSHVKDKSESSEESSEEEEIVKPKQPKKRKKVMSDSD